MKTSSPTTNIGPALLAAQKMIGVAVKGAANPYFDAKYADLRTIIEAVKKPLNDQGIVILQGVDIEETIPLLVTTLLHAETSEFVETRTPILCVKANNPQAFGSGVTYAKRYALQALLCLPTSDDDGNAAAKEPEPEPEPKEPEADNPKARRITKAEFADLLTVINVCGVPESIPKFLAHFKVSTLADLTLEQAEALSAGIRLKTATKAMPAVDQAMQELDKKLAAVALTELDALIAKYPAMDKTEAWCKHFAVRTLQELTQDQVNAIAAKIESIVGG